MSAAGFSRLYRQLDPQQREAVDATDGPVMVIAGPGTGKTTVLALRIAQILRTTDTPADAILALTFTEAGVSAMRKRLLSIIGPRAYEVRIHTFHSFANDLIKRYPEVFPRIIGSEHMEGVEQVRIVENLIDRLNSRRLRPENNPTYYCLPVIDALKALKREDFSPREYGQLLVGAKSSIARVHSHRVKGGRGGDEKFLRSRELVRLYRAYEKELRRRRLYDFEDMIVETNRALEKSEELKLRLQEEYQYILADEHQDANRAQNRLLELLSDYDERPNLFIVGDDKQAIFRFQGASLENFRYFRRRFPSARVIALTNNYRSQREVLRAAHSLMDTHTGDGERPVELFARAKHLPEKIRVVEAADERAELSFIANEVKRLLGDGVAAKDIAVLARENRDAEKLERALHEAGIVVARRGDSNALESARIDLLRKLFAAALSPLSDELLAPTLFFDFLALPPLPVMEAVHAREGGHLLHRLKKGGKELATFADKLLSWQRIARSESLVQSFEHIAHDSGFLRHALSREDASRVLALYASFLEAAKRLAERDKRARLADFLERLSRAEAHGIGVLSSAESEDGVAVMTAHKAKGLEFDAVFIAFAQDGKWGGRRSRALFLLPLFRGEEESDAHDERRLFYVALTRARKTAYVSWHAMGDDSRALLPSRFIFEMDEKTRVQRTHAARAADRAPLHKVPMPVIFRDRAYLNALFLGQRFAVTHLNNFLLCPLKYFFLNLIRLPRAQTGAELFGSAMHAALAFYFRAYARDEDKPLSEVAGIFEGALRRTHLSDVGFRAYARAGKEALRGYLVSRAFPRACLTEYVIGGVALPLSGKKLELTGTLDKVEFISDSEVSVVDYKTGEPRSRNELLGKTKQADGNYYRQLVFYKLLIGGLRKKGWRMKTGAIDFLKPAKGGGYRREVFEIADDEVVTLKKQIQSAAESILNLSFFDRGCGKKECEYCRLHQALR